MAAVPAGAEGEYASTLPSRFRMKSNKRRREDHEHAQRKQRRSNPDEPSVRPNDRHRSRRHNAWDNVYDDPSLYDDTYLPNARSEQYADPDTAFRDSLFDALADDEGAAYWEGVYGQPIHTYARPGSQGPDGELERMSDEEYAEYVRAKMWEKTHQHVLEEKARREERRKREAEERERGEREGHKAKTEHQRWQEQIEESLRIGERRRKSRRWNHAWDTYVKGWDALLSATSRPASDSETAAQGRIPWPVVTGRWKDVAKEDVEAFFEHAPEEASLSAILKAERVRWHPDKMQQRFGGSGIDVETMKSVTAVFQVVDRMWSNMKGNRGREDS